MGVDGMNYEEKLLKQFWDFGDYNIWEFYRYIAIFPKQGSYVRYEAGGTREEAFKEIYFDLRERLWDKVKLIDQT